MELLPRQLLTMLAAICWCHILFAVSAFSAPNPETPLRVESVEIVGSRRITVEQLREQLRITDSTVMTDEWMMDGRQNLLGLGLFREVIFSMRKGSRPGLAKLVVVAADDQDVVSDWAIGGEFSLSLKEPGPTFEDDSIFRGYKLGLIARNILLESHRGAMVMDINSKGNLVQGQLAYGMPRFVSESIQFDAGINAVDPKERYFETEGYGLKIQSLWTRQRRGYDLLYGAAWYSNEHRNYGLRNWPTVIAGPKIGLQKETRLLGFLPSPGYRFMLALIPSLIRRDQPVVESEIAGTVFPLPSFALSLSAGSLTTGRTAITSRSEAKIEVPLASSSKQLRSLAYLTVRHGQDRFKAESRSGTESAVGTKVPLNGLHWGCQFPGASERPLA